MSEEYFKRILQRPPASPQKFLTSVNLIKVSEKTFFLLSVALLKQLQLNIDRMEAIATFRSGKVNKNGR